MCGHPLSVLIAVREELALVTRDAVNAIDGMSAAGQASKAEVLQARIEAREGHPVRLTV